MFVGAHHFLGSMCVLHIISLNSHSQFYFYSEENRGERERERLNALLKIPQLANVELDTKCRLIRYQSCGFRGLLC